MADKGRVTLPIEQGMDDQLPGILERLGADAVRNSDGTWLPEITSRLGVKVYETYFPSRGNQEFAEQHLDARPRFYLMSPRITALEAGELSLDIMRGYYALQVAPDQTDVARWWQVIDRTTGETIDPSGWRVEGEGAETRVVVSDAAAHHVYTVNFMAWQTWDSTQMYNYLTNNWWDDPTRVREIGYDARDPRVWQFMQDSLREWCATHSDVDVVRFTTFFYHFTLVFNDAAKEKFVDWFGYSASVSPAAIEAFEAEYGHEVRAEDFIDEGYYNNPFRPPSRLFRDWIDFQSRFVCERITVLVDIVHEAGKQAMMFLGDNWIGTEPYGDCFAATGMDAVVGSVGSAATCRMIADIPGVTYTEGRFLPYFFPDVFRPGGDPLGEANESWLCARRAIVRHPLDRIGYGGYLSLAVQFDDFMNRVEQIANEFRSIHDNSNGELPVSAPIRVAIINAWGSLRTWQNHMVAHALWYKQIYSYLGVLEALAGLPFDVSFLTFDEVREGALADVDVALNVGAAGTAFSGGTEWLDAELTSAVRAFVAAGGGFIGIGEPTAIQANGAFFQLGDVLGVDAERSFSLSTDRYPAVTDEHFITAELDGALDVGEGAGDIVAFDEATQILRLTGGSIDIAARQVGDGRGVYLAGLPYSPVNSRLLQRAIFWAASAEGDYDRLVTSDNVAVEVAAWPNGRVLAYNNSAEPQRVRVQGDGIDQMLELDAMEGRWLTPDA